ncbi:RNase H family protein [Marinifilum fragile]
MEIIKIKLQVKSIKEDRVECFLSDENENIRLFYDPDKGEIKFEEESNLAATIHRLKFQFKKVVRSAIKGNLQPNQTINCVFIEDFRFLEEADFNTYIRVDRRKSVLQITTSKTETKDIHKIYADASHSTEFNQSAYGGFTEDPYGTQQIYSRLIEGGSSNMMELLAVTDGLQRLKSVEKIQINTDSRFVIRGLVQWVHFWQHNHWQTAFGRDVQFAKHWKEVNELCKGKLMEFNWIKGHSGNEKQDFCHRLARKTMNNE